METKIIKFNIEKGFRAPKEINKENMSFVIFSPNTMTIKAGSNAYIHLKFSAEISNEYLTTYVETSNLKKKGLKVIGQFNEQGQRVRLEYYNKENKDCIIKKNKPIAIFTIINAGNVSVFLKKIFTIQSINQSINQ